MVDPALVSNVAERCDELEWSCWVAFPLTLARAFEAGPICFFLGRWSCLLALGGGSMVAVASPAGACVLVARSSFVGVGVLSLT